MIRPTFIVEDKPAIEKAKQQALTNFGPELLKRMRAVRATFAGGVVNAVAVTPAPAPVTPEKPPAVLPPIGTPLEKTPPAALPILPVAATKKATSPVPMNLDVPPLPANQPIQPIILK